MNSGVGRTEQGIGRQSGEFRELFLRGLPLVCLRVERFFHIHLHHSIHLEERRRGAFPSFGTFFVASMPSLLAMAISLVVWSSMSARPLKMLFRLRQGLGGQARRVSLSVRGQFIAPMPPSRLRWRTPEP